MYTILGEGDGTPLQYSCLENLMGGGAWWAAVHGVAKSRTRLSNFTFTFHFHALEKEMATHSSVLAWRIPGTVEPDRLPSRVAQSQTRLKRLSNLAVHNTIKNISRAVSVLQTWHISLRSLYLKETSPFFPYILTFKLTFHNPDLILWKTPCSFFLDR